MSEEEVRPTIITVDDKRFELKYNFKTVEQIENVTEKPLMSDLKDNEGLMSLSSLRTYVTLALYGAEGTRVGHGTASKVFEEWIQSEGYGNVARVVLLQLQKDVPFFFQTDSTD